MTEEKKSAKQRRETLLAGVDAAGERLDLFLARTLPGVSRKAVKRALDGGQVFVDGRCERRAGLTLAGGETVLATLPVPAAAKVPPPPEVIYRDAHLLAVAKPAGLPSHPTVADRANALGLVTALLRGEGNRTTPILLHRLDADTTGVLLFALTAESNRALARQFSERQVSKVYHALVAGSPPDEFTVRNHLRAGVRGRTVAVQSGGAVAETGFRTLARRHSDPTTAAISLVEARPKTGRTHQIRVHLADEGFPLLGDRLYGGPDRIETGTGRQLLTRHLLHARALSFRHPVDFRQVTIEAPWPGDFLAVWPDPAEGW